MTKQFKLFKNVNKITPNNEMLTFLDAKIIGVEYPQNSKEMLAVTAAMTSQGFTQFFVIPRYLTQVLNNTKKHEKFRINDIDFSVKPEIEVGVLLDAFYEQEESKRSKRLSEILLKLLYENDAKKFSFYVKNTNPVTKINIYQTGLVHMSNNTSNLGWFDDLFEGVLE